MSDRTRQPALRIGAVVFASMVHVNCGSSSTPAAPSPPTPPPPANVAGNWTGNLESSNYTASAVNVTLNQTGTNVTGTWAIAIRDWNGTITGTTDTSSFTGTFTFSGPNALGAGPRCTGTASVSGGASTSGPTVVWTSPGFTGSCTGMPVGLRWNLQRR